MEELSNYKTLIEEYDKFCSNCDTNEKTFLSVIKKEHHENYVSKILAYTIEKDLLLLKKLINYGCKKEVIKEDENIRIKSLQCEKYMYGRRADIFVEVINGDKLITLTIENKVNTGEHDDQTVDYYKWVNNNANYSSDSNSFIYLCPDYNMSEPSCKEFKKIKYSELVGWIKCDDDFIIKDFMTHIKKYYGEKNMEIDNKDILLISRYSEILRMNQEATEAVIKVQSNIKNKICELLKIDSFNIWTCDKDYEDLDEGNFLFELQPKTGVFTSLRIFFKNETNKWWEKDKYYFYIEIRFDRDNDGDVLGKISFQSTVWIKSKEQEMIKSLRENTTQLTPYNGGYYVIDAKEYRYDAVPIGTNEWICNLVNEWNKYREDSKIEIEKAISTVIAK